VADMHEDACSSCTLLSANGLDRNAVMCYLIIISSLYNYHNYPFLELRWDLVVTTCMLVIYT
jgi:hypothetical protein